MSEQITTIEIRELLNAVQILATRPAAATQRELMLAPVLFAKLMDCRTNGLVQIKTIIDGKEVNLELSA